MGAIGNFWGDHYVTGWLWRSVALEAMGLNWELELWNWDYGFGYGTPLGFSNFWSDHYFGNTKRIR